MTGRRAWLGLAAAALLSLPAETSATHTVDHRYVVLGYVRDPAGRPIPGAAVRVVREKSGLAHDGETDVDGFYLVIVHLHDKDLLDPLVITAGPRALRVQARFDPLNARSHRGTRVDFIGGEGWERQEDFAHTLDGYLRG